MNTPWGTRWQDRTICSASPRCRLAGGAVLLVALSAVHLEGLERWAERAGALALLGMGLWGLRGVSGGPLRAAGCPPERQPVT